MASGSSQPVIVRWAAGVPDRALVTRTIVHLGEGAEAALVEELVASGPPIVCAEGEPVPQSLFTGTLEVTLAAHARLAVASIQDLPAGVTVFQHRNAVIGEGADLHWALAQLGGRIVRSRVDNRLEGDRSCLAWKILGEGCIVIENNLGVALHRRDHLGHDDAIHEGWAEKLQLIL